MQHCEFMFQGERLQAFANGTLFWPRKQLLAVADLHLGKSARMARTGRSLLPPYELIDTLDRLATEADSARPKVLVCLGDSFDDDIAATELGDRAEQKLESILHGRRCVWISGNHDPRAPCRRTARFGIQGSAARVPPRRQQRRPRRSYRSFPPENRHKNQSGQLYASMLPRGQIAANTSCIRHIHWRSALR